ncbi:MAG: RIP metalloprotease RseP [Candidatus Binatia bacterium]|nr:RIP metalloprotease RseP [Candidatus Binatia bacterium]
MVTNILAAILVLGLLIFVHELGHFLAAKWVGVGVLKFSLGFGPALISRRVGDTDYCLSAIPLGGFVKMVGQEDDGSDPDPKTVDQDNSFAVKPSWAKAVIVSAGPVFNFLFAWLLYTILFATGVPVLTSQIGDVKEDMPAAAAGIEKGDEIVAVNGQAIDRWEDLSNGIKAGEGAPVSLKVLHDGVERTMEVTPKQIEGSSIFGEPIPTWVIGVGPAGKIITERSNPIVAIGQGFMRTVEFVRLTVVSIVKLFQRVVPASSLGGPIMIMKIAGDQANEGIQALIAFMAILSINLGVINLLPIPILDGGHLLFLGIEKVVGHPIQLRTREIATQVGMFLLISLMGFALYNDIHRLVVG